MIKGAIQKVCHRPRGGGGSSKIVTKSDKGGRGVKPNGDVTVYQFQRKMYRKIIHVNYDIFANLELFTLADNCIRGFKHIKHCFFVLFCCLSV